MFPSFPFRNSLDLWQRFSLLERLFAFALVMLAIRSLVGAVRAWLVLRKIRKLDASENGSARAELARLERQCASRAMCLQAMFYLFAAVTSLVAVQCYNYSVDSNIPGGFFVLGQMIYVFAFAYLCSFVFVVVHIVNWISSSRVTAASRQTQHAASS
jgi:hypothetical protein